MPHPTKRADLSVVARLVRKYGPEKVLGMLDAEQRQALPFMWRLLARPKQLAPDRPWRWWVIQSGRGFGKTRSAAEWVREKVKRMPGSLGAIVGQTPDEARAVQVEGKSGILAVSPANERPEWTPSTGILRWANGATATVYSGANPGEFRGPEHHWAWVDEFAKYGRARDVYDNLNMGLRLEYVRKGSDPRDREPQCLISTTPRPIAVMRELVKKKNAIVTLGSTYENRANLAESFLQEIRDAYEGTRIGRQEIGGDLLDDVPGALWSREWFDRPGFRQTGDLSLFDLIAVAIDPAASSTESSDETGIVVMGMWRDAQGRRRFHVLADRSIYGTAKQRARAAILAMLDFEADAFVVETNNGGDWIPAVINAEWEDMKRDPSWAEKLVGMPRIACVTATRGKHTRAEPISTLYEQLGTVTHEPGLEELEDQMVTWSPLLNERSPDRMDALVWAGTYLSTAKVFVAT